MFVIPAASIATDSLTKINFYGRQRLDASIWSHASAALLCSWNCQYLPLVSLMYLSIKKVLSTNYRILGIIHGRKHSQILWILEWSRMFFLPPFSQYNLITLTTNMHSWEPLATAIWSHYLNMSNLKGQCVGIVYPREAV